MISSCGRTEEAQAFYEALLAGDISALDEVAADGIDVNGEMIDGWTPLPFSIGNKRFASAEWLLSRGADANSMDGGGNSAISWAVKMRSGRHVRLLLERGSDPLSLRALSKRERSSM
ncbi:ankyrin repeat domain-containing protein [Stenotrophomonas sp. NPDC077464]|uniref:ankyrin repeat domain-containing protein n=1 Tax=unclassified Stenotrophomonas TaxID=196198 RepID=UPI0037CFF465